MKANNLSRVVEKGISDEYREQLQRAGRDVRLETVQKEDARKVSDLSRTDKLNSVSKEKTYSLLIRQEFKFYNTNWFRLNPNEIDIRI